MNTYTQTQIDALIAAKVDLNEFFGANAPAKTAPTPARKATTKPVTRKASTARKAPAKRTAQPKADLGKKGWNKALTALARSQGAHTSGVSTYRVVQDAWAQAQELREAGKTPAQALKAILKAA